MARRCGICDKGSQSGYSYTFLRSHWNPQSKRRWIPNLQPMRVNLNGSIVRLKVCTSCIKKGAIQKWVKGNHKAKKAV